MIRRKRRVTTRTGLRSAARIIAITSVTLSTVACGRGLFSSSGGSGSAAGGIGTPRSVYVTNFGDGQIAALHRETAGLTNPATLASGSINGPVGLAIIPGHTLYVANAGENTIHQFAVTSNGNLTTLATIAAGSNTRQPVLNPAGTFAYAINSGGSISEYKIDSTTGELAANTTASTTSGLVQPVSGAATKSFLYVTDQQSGAGVVLTFKINTDGTLAASPSSTPSFGVPGGAAVPNQILIDPTGKWVFVSDGAAGRVSLLKVAGSGTTFINSFLTSAPGTAEAGLLYLKKGNNIFIYCSDQASDAVSVFLFEPGTQTLTLTSASPPGSLSGPIGLATDKKGDILYVANNVSGTVTQFTIDAADGSLSAPVSSPTENPVNASSAPEFILVTD